MRAQRLDLGVDIVVVPDQDVVFIHPDLSFGQAVGAVSAALPSMHPDAVVALVAQVSQRPQPKPRRAAWRLSAAAGTAVAAVAGLLALGMGSEPYGERWESATREMGLTCRQSAHDHTCRDPHGNSYRVSAFTSDDGALYVLRSEGAIKYVRAFDGGIPTSWMRENPAAVAVGATAATWQ